MGFASAQPILRAVIAQRRATTTGVVLRLVRNCALGRGTQYAAAVVVYENACGYWIPAFAGMTIEDRVTAGHQGRPR